MKTGLNAEMVERSIVPLRDGQPQAARTDCVAVEAPLEIRFEGRNGTILMRTPGHDDELVRGFLFAESIIRTADDIIALQRPACTPDAAGGQIIDITLARKHAKIPIDRSFMSSASCGACGKTSLDSLAIAAPRVDSQISVSSDVLTKLPDRLKSAQSTFLQTGGVHASGLFTVEGDLIALREDVGRHNALDKLIGWALAEGRLPLGNAVLVLSGRISYELVQKAVMASIPVVAAVGAPSSMAIEIAERYGITLAGFVRPNSFNVYTHAIRIEIERTQA